MNELGELAIGRVTFGAVLRDLLGPPFVAGDGSGAEEQVVKRGRAEEQPTGRRRISDDVAD